ncbi:SpoIIE family protein phosphatase [Gaiella sp.]|uniref:ATP-binding SpoIIE family protein phosphatase n=1 Tax=Gaiella sp. TaxID=2663207 RepID=UPI003267FC5D
MTAIAQTWRKVTRKGQSTEAFAAPVEATVETTTIETPAVEIAPNDPLVAFLQSAGEAVEVDKLELESPGVTALREAGVALVVPLISGGELVGTLNLGPRLSDQQYSTDDKRLLDGLAAQAAPALQVAELVRKQAAEARSRERIEQELKVATLIQQNFLPRVLPDLPGWEVAAYYQPAREVGGDFYDLFELPDGQVAVIIGDVTDKGVPAAMVMAAARSLLRASGQRVVSPGEVLERVNDLLCPDIPEKMFVTCLYLVVDPSTGHVRYANAGHNLPYARTADGSMELRAKGMPLGLLPGMKYDEHEAMMSPGDGLLLYSDGVTEAHGAEREMFGTPRLVDHVADPASGDLIDGLLTQLQRFTGDDWEQEDDITLVTLTRTLGSGVQNGRVTELDVQFTLPSETGNEREAMQRVLDAIAPLGLEERRVERLGTAVSEAAMNAIEHGNQGRAEIPVEIEVVTAGGELVVRIRDVGEGPQATEVESPDIEAKLAGLQKPRGWGLFLIKNMVDEIRVIDADGRHTVELVLQLEGGDGDGSDGA